MMHIERALAVSLLAALVSACAALHPHGNTQSTTATESEPQPVTTSSAEMDTPPTRGTQIPSEPLTEIPAPESARVADLLREAADYGASSPEEQRAAIDGAGIRLGNEQTPQALVRFALLLSLSDANRQLDIDTSSRLLDLLTQPSAESTDADLVPLAQLLAHTLGERGRLSAQNSELTRKLNQLKAIERQLGDRDGTDMPPPSP